MKFIKLIILFLCCSFSVTAQNNELEKYLKIAEKNNPGLKAHYKTYERMLQRIPQVKALPDPYLGIGYFVSPAETRVGAQQAKLSITQMFPWFGTLSAKEQEAAFQAKAAQDQYFAQRNKLEYQVKAMWAKLYFLQKKIEFSQQQETLFKTLQNQAKFNFENNRSTMVDVLRFQMNKDEMTTTIQLLTDQIYALKKQFNLLLNQDENTQILVQDTLLVNPKAIFTQDSILANNPLLKSIDNRSLASEYRVKYSKLSAYPNFGLGLDYVFVQKRTDITLPDNGKDIIMPMLNISIPIHFKKYQANIKESQLKREQIAFEKINIQNYLLSEYEAANKGKKNAQDDLELYVNLLQTVNQALAIATIAYSTSGKDYKDVLELQNLLLVYKIKKSKALVDLFTFYSYLEYLIKK